MPFLSLKLLFLELLGKKLSGRIFWEDVPPPHPPAPPLGSKVWNCFEQRKKLFTMAIRNF